MAPLCLPPLLNVNYVNLSIVNDIPDPFVNELPLDLFKLMQSHRIFPPIVPDPQSYALSVYIPSSPASKQAASCADTSG
jgi:hypothetical protein